MKVKENTPLFLRTIALVKHIPKGSVATYGQVASMIGAHGCARHVSFILSSSSKKHKLPWQRVVNSSGAISEHKWALKQRSLLIREGVGLSGKTINYIFSTYQISKESVPYFFCNVIFYINDLLPAELSTMSWCHM